MNRYGVILSYNIEPIGLTMVSITYKDALNLSFTKFLSLDAKKS